MSDQKYLCINMCTKHGVYSISIDSEDSGLRVTPSKCCGSWSEVKRWPIDGHMVRDIADELGFAHAIKAREQIASGVYGNEAAPQAGERG